MMTLEPTTMLGRLVYYLESPMSKLKRISPQLEDLQQRLEGAKYIASPGVFYGNDPFRGLIAFLRAVSPWDDSGKIRQLIGSFERVNRQHQFDEVVALLKNLEKHLAAVGRRGSDPERMNQTSRGEIVTEENVFLGYESCGLYLQPISVWKRIKDSPRDAWRNIPHLKYYLRYMNPYDVMVDLAKKILDSHVDPMIEIIEQLRAIA